MNFTENDYAWDPCEIIPSKPKKDFIKNFPNMIVTPVPQNRKANGRKDYKEQMKRIKEGKLHVWDDSRYNKAEKGDYFAYAENRVLTGDKLTDGIIHIYLIKDIGKPENRLPSWSKNVGQGDRNVLELTSEPLYKGTLKDWIFHLNYKENYKVQGTIHVKYDRIENYITNILNNKFDLKINTYNNNNNKNGNSNFRSRNEWTQSLSR